MDRLATKYLKPRKALSTACAGCGLGQVHKKILLAIEQLGIADGDLVWGAGIGCTGRQIFNTWKGDNFAGTHGRVYALATGLRLALPPEKKILLTVGDGDAFGIGLLHLLHCARRNADLTVIVADNFGYQSTGGQYAWTTPDGAVTDSSPHGMQDPNWMQNGRDILDMLRAAGAGFLARYTSVEGRNAVSGIRQAIEHRGFSLVHIIYPCVTHFFSKAPGIRQPADAHRWLRDRTNPSPSAEFPASELTFKTGIFHRAGHDTTPEFGEQLRAFTKKIREGGGHDTR
ncbi:MAG: hypothetical protein LBD30_05595 [Verrucomicrobiales bacterium]|jgi:2-oxoglutarate ferredoxin oxidoreductase subunit beta|nr:hypothetical protein [Verrucomicrobiales bacterium]